MIETLKSKGFFKFGKIIPNLEINGQPAPYPVLNDRAVRAGAGIMFLLASFAFFHAFYLGNYMILKFVVPIFLIEFFIKVVVGTKFAPIGLLAGWIVRKQTPEYVGAVQKRFAWSLGLTLATVMSLLLFVFNVQGVVNLSICALCMIFTFMESAFGICVGCKIYGGLISAGFIKEPDYMPVCPGNVCSVE